MPPYYATTKQPSCSAFPALQRFSCGKRPPKGTLKKTPLPNEFFTQITVRRRQDEVLFGPWQHILMEVCPLAVIQKTPPLSEGAVCQDGPSMVVSVCLVGYGWVFHHLCVYVYIFDRPF